jgi:restriction system protein
LSRRGSFRVAMQRIAREQARQHRQDELARQRQARERVRTQREQLRLHAQQDRQQRERYLESRAAEAEEMTSDIQARMESLAGILEVGLEVNPVIAFDSLRESEALSEFVAPRNLATAEVPPKLEDFTKYVQPMSWLERLLARSGRYERDTHHAEARFAEATIIYATAEADRQKLISNLRIDHEAANAERLVGIRERNFEVDQTESAYQRAEPAAVGAYCSLVLNNSRYPDGFPREGRTAYRPDSKELVIDFELPTADIVPTVAECRFIKSTDIIEV